MKGDRTLRVQPIRNGTVIDHIVAGRGLKVMETLGLDQEGTTVLALLNVSSGKLGRKDIIKIEDRELSAKDIETIAMFSPNCHVNTIRNYKVVEKVETGIPSDCIGLARCQNRSCISNTERDAVPKLRLIAEAPLFYRCNYCDRGVAGDDLEFS